jgi:hypothetical protein
MMMQGSPSFHPEDQDTKLGEVNNEVSHVGWQVPSFVVLEVGDDDLVP